MRIIASEKNGRDTKVPARSLRERSSLLLAGLSGAVRPGWLGEAAFDARWAIRDVPLFHVRRAPRAKCLSREHERLGVLALTLYCVHRGSVLKDRNEEATRAPILRGRVREAQVAIAHDALNELTIIHR